jgi:hypothetical protein
MGKTKSYNYNDAIRYNRFKDVEKLYAKGHKFHRDNLSNTLKQKNLKLFKWFLEKGAPLQQSTFNQLLELPGPGPGLQKWDLAKDILLGKIRYNFYNHNSRARNQEPEPYPEDIFEYFDYYVEEEKDDIKINYIKEKFSHPLISITPYLRIDNIDNEFDRCLDTMEIAAKHNNLDFILFLKDNNLSDWTLNLVNIAAFYNNYSLVRKLVDLGCPVGSFLFLKDVYIQYKIYKWTHEQKYVFSSPNKNEMNTLSIDLNYYLFEKDWSININSFINSITYSLVEHEIIRNNSYEVSWPYNIETLNKLIMKSIEKYIIRENDIELLEKLLSKNYSLTYAGFEECLSFGNKEVLKLFIDRDLIDWEKWYYNFDCNAILKYGPESQMPGDSNDFEPDNDWADPSINRNNIWANEKPYNLKILKNHILKKLITYKKDLEDTIDEHKYSKLTNYEKYRFSIIEKSYKHYNEFVDFFIKILNIESIDYDYYYNFHRLEQSEFEVLKNQTFDEYFLERKKTKKNPWLSDNKLPMLEQFFTNASRYVNIKHQLTLRPARDYDDENAFINPIDYTAYLKDIELTKVLLNNGWKFNRYTSSLALFEKQSDNFSYYKTNILERELFYKWCISNGAEFPFNENVFDRFQYEAYQELNVYSITRGYKFSDKMFNIILKELNWDMERYDNLKMPYMAVLRNYFDNRIIREICKKIYNSYTFLEEKENKIYKIENLDKDDSERIDRFSNNNLVSGPSNQEILDEYFEIIEKKEEFNNYDRIINLYKEKLDEIKQCKIKLTIHTNLPIDIIEYCIIPFI